MAGVSREADPLWQNRVDAGTVIDYGFRAPGTLEGISNVIRKDLIWACQRIIDAAKPLPDECPMAGELSG